MCSPHLYCTHLKDCTVIELKTPAESCLGYMSHIFVREVAGLARRKLFGVMPIRIFETCCLDFACFFTFILIS
jgi:hypothetical protein